MGLKVRLNDSGMYRVRCDTFRAIAVVDSFGGDDVGLLAVAVAFPGEFKG